MSDPRALFVRIPAAEADKLDRAARETGTPKQRLIAGLVARYLDPERTFGLAVLAVPDAAHSAAPEAHAEGWRDGVLVVPYSLTLPYVLARDGMHVICADVPALTACWP